MATQPNFVFIITDQHRADYLGCYGHPVLKTPHIDSLAASGVRFERFHVATPICMPNRATLMTGRMPSLHGLRHNGLALNHLNTTYTDLLRDCGYRTALIGKSHLQAFTDVPAPLKRKPSKASHKPRESLLDATKPYPGEGRYDQELPENWSKGEDFLDLPFYGFDYVKLVTRHGDRCGGHYEHWLRREHPEALALRGPDKGLPHDYVCPQAWRTAVPEELYPTTYIANESARYIREHAAAGAGKPFFLKVSFPDPHHPFTAPGKYWDMYRPEDMRLPESFHGGGSVPPHVAWARAERDAGTDKRGGPSTFAVNERETLEAMALTCGSIAMIDDAVGRLLAALDETGLRDNTVIIFTTDHGDFLGDHQLLLKGPIHYQSLIRVPFIWSEPGLAARVSQALSGTIDFAQTVLDRADIEPFNGIQGESLLPVIRGEKAAVRDALLIEEDGQRTYLGFNAPVRCRTVRSGDYRMTIYQGVSWGELYDLGNDPGEMRNLWDEPGQAAVRASLMETLARLEMEAADRSPLPTWQG